MLMYTSLQVTLLVFFKSFLYQATYLLQLTHFVNHAFILLIRNGKCFKDIFEDEKANPSLCFKGLLAVSLNDQTIFYQLLNNLMTFLCDQKEDKSPRFHWMPSINTRLIRLGRSRHSSNRDNIARL